MSVVQNIIGNVAGSITDVDDTTKKVSFDFSSASTGTTITLKSNATAPRQINLIDSDGEVLLKDATQIVTHKTIIDPTNIISSTHLTTASGTINISNAAAPTVGQIMVATSPTTISWQNPNRVIATILVGSISQSSTGIKTAIYQRLGTFSYPGTSTSMAITKIAVISYMEAAQTGYSIKVVNLTTNPITTISEQTFTNTTESIQLMTSVVNIPSAMSRIEVQGKGDVASRAFFVDSITFWG